MENLETQKEKRRLRAKLWREANPLKVKARNALYNLENRAKIQARKREYLEENREKSRKWHMENYNRNKQKPEWLAKRRKRCKLRCLKIKNEIIEKYGGHCNACKITELAVLSIDHINDDGAEEKLYNGGGYNFYWHLYKTPRREDLQVLCMNCQFRKREYGSDFSTWPVYV